MIPFVDLKTQYLNLKPEIDKAISNVIDTCAFINGPDVHKFNIEFAEYTQSKYALGVSSGHSALELIFESLELPKGSEVIVPVNSYISTALAPSFMGLKVVFCDCDPVSYNIDPTKIEKLITQNTRVIAVTHLYGNPCDMDPIMEIAKKYNLIVVEDSAQAHGAMYKGKPVGSFGIATAYSFYPGKNLGCFGDGGAITTNDSALYQKLKLLYYFGQTEKYVHVIKGRNEKLDTIQAAVLRVKLPHLNNWLDARLKNAKLYNKHLNGLPVVTPFIREDVKHVFHVYCLKLLKGNRDDLLKYLSENGVQGNIHYPIPIHRQGAYVEMEHKIGDFPISEDLSDKIISLPMYPELTEDNIYYICNVLTNYFLSIK